MNNDRHPGLESAMLKRSVARGDDEDASFMLTVDFHTSRNGLDPYREFRQRHCAATLRVPRSETALS